MPTPFPAPTPPPVSDLIPERHLARLTGLQSPRIVIVGDSISTPKPIVTHDMIDGFWGHFQRVFLLSNPGMTPEFVNRAIGRTRFVHFARSQLKETLAVAHKYPWATDPEAHWFDEVEALKPDLLIQAFGMNDSHQFNTAAFQALQARIDRWDKQPDRIYVTTMLPSRNSDREPHSSKAGQTGRLYNAHYIRSWAIRGGYGLIDLNRTQCQVVQGFDPRVSDLRASRAQGAKVPSAAPKPCQDFGLVLGGPDLGADLAAGLRVQIGTGKPAANGVAALVLQLDGDNHLSMAFSDLAEPAPPYFVQRSRASVGAVPETLSIFVKDVFAHVELDGETLFFDRIRRHGGPFSAEVARVDGASSNTDVRYFTGSFRQHEPVLSDDEAFGAKAVAQHVTGGNARNHPASLMSAYVFAPLLEALRLTVP